VKKRSKTATPEDLKAMAWWPDERTGRIILALDQVRAFAKVAMNALPSLFI
jgi:hypothetical protein